MGENPGPHAWLARARSLSFTPMKREFHRRYDTSVPTILKGQSNVLTVRKMRGNSFLAFISVAQTKLYFLEGVTNLEVFPWMWNYHSQKATDPKSVSQQYNLQKW
jgi:hypothetical protein